jgi:hypothetical protein
MSRYKVLPLPTPFDIVDEEKWFEEDVPLCLHTRRKIPPVFHRPGWYYDRKADQSWIETVHGCWLDYRPDDFLFQWQMANHKPLPEKVREAIETIMAYNLCPKELRRLFQVDNDWRELTSVRRGVNEWKLRALKEKGCLK